MTVVYTSLDDEHLSHIKRGFHEMFDHTVSISFTNDRTQIPKLAKLIIFVSVYEFNQPDDYTTIARGIPGFEELYYRPNTIYLVAQANHLLPLFELRNLDNFFYSEVVRTYWQVSDKQRTVFFNGSGWVDPRYEIKKFLDSPLLPSDTRVRFRKETTRPQNDIAGRERRLVDIDHEIAVLRYQLAALKNERTQASRSFN
jgi:hypothetical protein